VLGASLCSPHVTLRSLNLSGNELGKLGCLGLGRALLLRGCPLTTLDVSGCQLTDALLVALLAPHAFNAFQEQHGEKRVEFAANDNSLQAAALVRARQQNTGMESVRNQSLARLALSNNCLSDLSAETLLKWCPPRLRALQLSGNWVTENGAATLLQLIQASTLNPAAVHEPESLERTLARPISVDDPGVSNNNTGDAGPESSDSDEEEVAWDDDHDKPYGGLTELSLRANHLPSTVLTTLAPLLGERSACVLDLAENGLADETLEKLKRDMAERKYSLALEAKRSLHRELREWVDARSSDTHRRLVAAETARAQAELKTLQAELAEWPEHKAREQACHQTTS
jgi:hypothetical protein